MFTRSKISVAVASAVFAIALPVHAEETEDRGIRYEDDAWYDISEWFDGNDYNPTDESAWRWDDETYEAWEDTGVDYDSDYDDSYGYYDSEEGSHNYADSGWFYDYYDGWAFGYSPLSDNQYSYAVRYYDYDNDGWYDAYSSYTDRNGDGIYDRYNYHSFASYSDQAGSRSNDDSQTKKDEQGRAWRDSSDRQQTDRKSADQSRSDQHYSVDDQRMQQQRDGARADTPQSAQLRSVTGRIEKMKQVKVHERTHTVVQIKRDDRTIAVDLGPKKDLQKFELKPGDQITARGPLVKVGGKQLLCARSVTIDGEQHQINQHRRTLTGEITSTRKASLRGVQHQIVMIKTDGSQRDDGQSTQIAVDLGPADRLKIDASKGQRITITGFPVKLHGRPLIIAQSVRQNGESRRIDRNMTSASASD